MASGRVVGIVALCAAAAVAAIIGGTVLLSRHESTTLPGAIVAPRAGKPLLQLELGLRRDAEAVALRQAQSLLDDAKHPQPAQAAAIFKRYTALDARLGLAFAQWTGPQSLAGVQAIAAGAPDSPAALLNLGIADYQAGRNADAVTAWQQTASRFPDSPYAVDALDALSPGVLPGLPPIIFDPKAVPAKARPDLEAGVRAWDLRHVVTARRLLDAAAALAPDTPEALVADAVARFSPTSPKASFPILGPLSATFPHASIVRLHLGVLLLWNKQFALGKKQFRLAASEQPGSVYAKQARVLLKALGGK